MLSCSVTLVAPVSTTSEIMYSPDSSSRHSVSATPGLPMVPVPYQCPLKSRAVSATPVSWPQQMGQFGGGSPDGDGDGLSDGESLGDSLGLSEGDSDAEGDSDGDSLGLSDGDSDGLSDADGLRLGLSLGDSLGDSDADGDNDGDSLGDSDGLSLGDSDGDSDADGLRLGLSDGLSDGDSLGLSDGDSDADGLRLGDSDGLSLGDSLGLSDGDSPAADPTPTCTDPPYCTRGWAPTVGPFVAVNDSPPTKSSSSSRISGRYITSDCGRTSSGETPSARTAISSSVSATFQMAASATEPDR